MVSSYDVRGSFLIQFGANVIMQVLFYRLSFPIRLIIRKECNYNLTQLETSLEMSPIGNEPCVRSWLQSAVWGVIVCCT